MDVLVAYGACKRNQNTSSATPVVDGCMEFSSSYKGERKCEACGCHRSFHERIILMRDQNGVISCASQMVLPEMGHFQHLQSRPPSNKDMELAAQFITVNNNELSSTKRRKTDQAESPYSEFITTGKASPEGALVSTQQQPVPIKSLEAHNYDTQKDYGSIFKSSWLCEADRDTKGTPTPVNVTNTALSGQPPEKLSQFFERLQKEHPESPLKLEYVDGSWRVLCGVCARYLRADKKGETLHNIQKQHFVTPKHLSNLKAKLEAPDEMEFWLKRMAKLRDKRRAQTRFITAS